MYGNILRNYWDKVRYKEVPSLESKNIRLVQHYVAISATPELTVITRAQSWDGHVMFYVPVLWDVHVGVNYITARLYMQRGAY